MLSLRNVLLLLLGIFSTNYLSLFCRIELGTILNFNKEKASYMIEASDWKSDMLRYKLINLKNKFENYLTI